MPVLSEPLYLLAIGAFRQIRSYTCVAMIAQVSKKGSILIPREIRERYGIRPGDKIEFLDSDHVITFIPVAKEKHDTSPRTDDR